MNKNHPIRVQSRLFSSSNIQQNNLITPFYFKSKQQRNRISSKYQQQNYILNGLTKQQKRQRYRQQLNGLIKKWIDYQQSQYAGQNVQKQINNFYSDQQIPKKYSPVHRSSPLKRLFNQSNISNGPLQFSVANYNNYSSQLIKQQISQDIIHFLSANHLLLQKINFSLVQTLINIGVFTKYKKGQQIKHMFYSQKAKNQSLQNKKLGIILSGQIKLYNKLEGYEFKLNQQDTLGQHGLDSLAISFQNYRNISAKTTDQQTVILWIKKQHYEVLFKQSMKCGLKEEIKRLQGFLKINWIKKGVKKFQ